MNPVPPQLPPLDARIPHWKLNGLVTRKCPFCGSTDSAAVCQRPDHLIVRLCNQCCAFFVSPAPSDKQLDAFYENYDLHHRRAANMDFKELAAVYKRYDPFSDLRIRTLSSHMKFETAKVLDVGSGRSEFMYRLKKLGAAPVGLELDTKAIEFAGFLGLEVHQTPLMDFSKGSAFDLVAMLDLVEHPLNPMPMIEKAYELLRPGGLLILWTPNGDYAKKDPENTTFRVDLEHMQYLAPETCFFIASKLDSRIVHLETLGYPDLKNIDRPLDKEPKLKRFLKKLIKALPGYAMANGIRCGVLQRREDDRKGSYHLFCIFQKKARS